MKYNDYLVAVFERCDLKSMTIDSANDDLWTTTFEFKDGTTKQYKTSRNEMIAYCSKHYRRSVYTENNKDKLVRTWKRLSLILCTREVELNKLLNELWKNRN